MLNLIQYKISSFFGSFGAMPKEQMTVGNVSPEELHFECQALTSQLALVLKSPSKSLMPVLPETIGDTSIRSDKLKCTCF